MKLYRVIVQLPYGRTPLMLELDGARDVEILRAPELPRPPPLRELLESALATLRPARHVTLIVSDATRDEPRLDFIRAIRTRLPNARVTIAIATGTHGPAAPAFVDELAPLADAIVNHDGHVDRDLVQLGTTVRGTPMIVHRCVVETDLVVATGCIRPHYFAGFGAGAKAIFPGLGQAAAIRKNHAWKQDPRARAGILDGNPCREDIEEAVAMLVTPTFLVNGVAGPDHAIHAIVAGELRSAFRRGCALARPWFTVTARPAPLVIVSDVLPVTASLYQAAKLAAAAAPLVAERGTLAVVAECADGIGPVEIVNEAIFRIGVLPRLAPDVSLRLVSFLHPDEVRKTLLIPTDLDTLLLPKSRVIIMPNASHLICEAAS